MNWDLDITVSCEKESGLDQTALHAIMIANSEEDQMEDNFSDSKILLKSNLSNADKLEIIRFPQASTVSY